MDNTWSLLLIWRTQHCEQTLKYLAGNGKISIKKGTKNLSDGRQMLITFNFEWFLCISTPIILHSWICLNDHSVSKVRAINILSYSTISGSVWDFQRLKGILKTLTWEWNTNLMSILNEKGLSQSFLFVLSLPRYILKYKTKKLNHRCSPWTNSTAVHCKQN